MDVKTPRTVTVNQLAQVMVLFTLAVGYAIWTFSDLATPNQVNQTTTACTVQTVAVQTALADLIITGDVFAVIPSALGAEVIIEPVRVFHGPLPAAGVRIVAQPSQGSSNAGRGNEPIDLQFASEQPTYLLFLKLRPDGKYLTSRCYGSRLLGDGLTADELGILGLGTLAR